MALSDIALFLAIAAFYLLMVPARWRGWTLFILSVFGVYWLQPTLNIRWLAYSLATATLVLAVIGWLLTRPYARESARFAREDIAALAFLVITPLAVTLARELNVSEQVFSRPPPLTSAAVGIGLAAIAALTVWRAASRTTAALRIFIIVIIAIFIATKAEGLAAVLAGFLRGQAGQDATLASAVDIQWLGFSYLAFRLIHTLRDRQNGLLPALSLREYITYLVFFPALTAGPIDRAERFIEDFRAVGTIRGLDADRIVRAGARIAIGLFKKFVIADSLALFSLSAVSAAQAESTGALWVLLYAFAFRLYFDFSGYSDIAIGVGMLFGVQLPENFDRPYLKHTITAFWQSWHITLSNWVRFYVYSPLSRSLLRRKLLTPQKIVLVATLATMIVIGLWHGMTLSFLVWGMWHGIGLFVHKWWSDRTRKWQIQLNQQPSKLRLWRFTGVVLTFHFVVLGWVWFALPDFDTSLQVLLRLFGVN